MVFYKGMHTALPIQLTLPIEYLIAICFYFHITHANINEAIQSHIQ